jgi:hypothetical protein
MQTLVMKFIGPKSCKGFPKPYWLHITKHTGNMETNWNLNLAYIIVNIKISKEMSLESIYM